MPLEQNAECLRVAVNVQAQQFLIGKRAPSSAPGPSSRVGGRQARVAQAGRDGPETARSIPSLPPRRGDHTPQEAPPAAPRPRVPMIVNDQDEPWIATPKICAMYLLPP